MANEQDAAALKALDTQIKQLQSPVFVIPEGFPDAETIRKNVAEFLKKGATTVAHLIMLIHDEQKQVP